MSARTRRQKAALGVSADDSEDLSTGNGSGVSPPSKSTKRTPSKKRSRSAPKEEEKEENIFLFAPNLIGRWFLCEFQALLLPLRPTHL
jgi:CDP-diacylglycerol--inositol 3-phosphatidyltransferase